MLKTEGFSMRVGLLSLLLVLLLFGLPQPAQAGWIIRGDTIPAGQVVENDVVLYGTNVRIDGTVNGDVVAIGSNVVVNGTVAGSLVSIGRVIALNGQVDGSVYALARTLQLEPEFSSRHNVHFLGLLLDTQTGSEIGRDLVAASVRGRISSSIGRGLNAIILLLTFNGSIGLNSGAEIQNPNVLGQPVPGLLDNMLLFVGAGGTKISGFAAPLRVAPFQDEQAAQTDLLPDWLVTRLGDFAALLLVGLLALWLIPGLLDRWTDRLRAKPLPAAGFGFLAVVIFVNAAFIAILFGAVILLVGIWLGTVDLWEIAFLFWGLGFSILILAFCTFALAVFYGSKVIVTFLVASLIFKRFLPQAARYRVLALLLGLVLYELLCTIPYFGWGIEAIVVILGLGAIWLALRRTEQPAIPAETGTE